MPYIRLINDSLSRILHQPLYHRLLTFCTQYTPELPPEPVITNWLNRLYNGDPLLHILVSIDNNYTINAHSVIDVQLVNGTAIVVVHQCQHDKANSALVNEVMEYIDKLVTMYNAHCSLFFITKHNKALEKKYGYSVSRMVMIKATNKGNSDG
jgi:hypothetical protein